MCNLFLNITATKAAEQSGYTAESRNGLRIQAHRLLRKPRIARAVVEESKRRGAFLLPKTQRALAELIDNPQHADHFKALKLAREESGLSPIVRKALDINVKVEISQDEKIRHIVAFAQKMHIDPKTLLGYDPRLDEALAAIETDDELMALQ